MVLIITNEQDLAADLLVLEFERRGVSVLRCNTEHLPQWRVTIEPGQWWEIRDQLGRNAVSSAVTGVWWRRPEAPSVGSEIASRAERGAFNDQWRAVMEGLASVPGPRWVSSPAAIRAAEDKALQLAVAARLGFRVPTTLWTNDVVRVREGLFADKVVVKPVTAAAWEDEEGSAFVFTHQLDVVDLPNDEDIAQLIPVAFQQPIAPKHDVRVTVVGGQALAAITKSRAVDLDWRLDSDLQWTSWELSSENAQRCARLVTELGLRFGGIDLVLDDAGETWFLEINPNGEWGWLNREAGVPVVDALADELTGIDVGPC